MITREQFEDYETVRQSGVTSMFDVARVESLSGLSKEECLEIMRNYSKLKKKFAKNKNEVKK